jgi:hypothetical protein
MKRILLTLALGASLLFTPAAEAQRRPGPPEAQRSSLEAELHDFLQMHFRDYRRTSPDARYVAGFADLNGDGRPEAIVQVFASSACGSGGCNLHVFGFGPRGWTMVSTMTVANAPVRALDTRSRGWRDLSVRVAGGGIRGYDAQLRFNGRAYPGNPSIPPARPLTRPAPGQLLIAENDRGRPLF